MGFVFRIVIIITQLNNLLFLPLGITDQLAITDDSIMRTVRKQVTIDHNQLNIVFYRILNSH